MGEVIPLFAAMKEVTAGLSAAEPAEAAPHRSSGDAVAGESRPADEQPDAFTPIEQASLAALGRKGMSRRELERALAKRGYHEYAIADELDRLEAVGLIDDYALAQHLVAHLQERKGLAGSAIKAELARRVVSPGAIEYAMDLVDTSDELARARELATARARQYERLDPQVAERRLSAFLLRRGFSASTIRAAVEAATRSA